MAGMRMTALAAGLGAAIAAGPDEGSAQSTEFAIPLDRGGEILMNVSHVQRETQEAILDHLERCVDEAEKTRDECVADTSVTFAEENLDGIVREAHQRLQPLEGSIGLTVAELLQEPVFCDYAQDNSSQQVCAASTEAVQLAALDVQIAQARERRIAAETRVAAKEDHLEGVETRETSLDVNIENSRVEGIELDQDLEVANTVLAALRRVTE